MVPVISSTSVFKEIQESHKMQKLWRMDVWGKPDSKSSKVKPWPSSEGGWEAELGEQAKGSWGLKEVQINKQAGRIKGEHEATGNNIQSEEKEDKGKEKKKRGD